MTHETKIWIIPNSFKTDFMSFRNLPRFYVLLADFSIVLLSFILSYFIIKQFDFSDIWRKHLLVYTLTYCSCSLIIFYLMKIHTGVVRYTTIMDMVRIFGSIFLSSIIYWLPTASFFLTCASTR